MDSDGRVEHVSISIDDKLARQSDLPRQRCIFKVHDKLRKINPDAYEPEILAIGPYHRGKSNLQGMEEFKVHYLKSLLARKEEQNAERYRIAMRELEEKARKCYAEPIDSLTSDEFVDMLLLDGCFIIELFLKFSNWVRRDENDPIFKTSWMVGSLALDLILFENQLPFFILLKLYDLVEGSIPGEFINIALVFFMTLFKGLGEHGFDRNVVHNAQHLLGLLHSSACPSFARIVMNTSNWKDIKCASQLKKAGVDFKNAEGRNLFDITYSNGTMEIPHLTIGDRTESLFRNFIAHEQYAANNTLFYITSYCLFMDFLIDYPEDTSLLRSDGIITNWLGGDEVISSMFNKLCHNVSFDLNYFSYGKIFNDVNTHCGKKRNIWMATLRRDYFNSPWALISFLAAFVLLLLTITQTGLLISAIS